MDKDKVQEIIDGFINNTDRRAIYNEFSLQHELGIFLRKEINKIDKSYKVEFERNIDFFISKEPSEDWPKKEIDIVIYKDPKDKDSKFAIELKYIPKKAPADKRMSACKIDIQFMEKLHSESNLNFETFVLTISENSGMNEGKSNESIYQYFRGDRPKPIEGKYYINWKDFEPSINEDKTLKRKYYFLNIE